MAICDIQKLNRTLRADFLHMVENYLNLIKADIENPDKMKSFECDLSNNRKLKFQFIGALTKQKEYEVEFEFDSESDDDIHSVCLSDHYSDVADAIFKINRDISQLFFKYPI